MPRRPIEEKDSVNSAFHFLLCGFFFPFNYDRHHCQMFYIFYMFAFLSFFFLSPQQNVNNRGTKLLLISFIVFVIQALPRAESWKVHNKYLFGWMDRIRKAIKPKCQIIIKLSVI